MRELKNNYELKETKLRNNETRGRESVEKNVLELILRNSLSVSVRRAMFSNCINKIKPTHSLFHQSFGLSKEMVLKAIGGSN